MGVDLRDQFSNELRNQRNAGIEDALRAELEAIHATMVIFGPHTNVFINHRQNPFRWRPPAWHCPRCGLYRVGGVPDHGPSQGNRMYTQPTWEEWKSQARAEGTWETILKERGYEV
jgi:hypothetical protein